MSQFISNLSQGILILYWSTSEINLFVIIYLVLLYQFFIFKILLITTNVTFENVCTKNIDWFIKCSQIIFLWLLYMYVLTMHFKHYKEILALNCH